MPRYKGLIQDWEVVQEFDNVTNQINCLTQRDQNVIIAALTPLRWDTRWVNLEDVTDLDYIDQLIGKLVNCRVVEEITYADCIFYVKYSDEVDPVQFADIRECITSTITEENIDDPPYDRTDGQYDGSSVADDLDCLWGACLSATKYMILQANRTIDIVEGIVGAANQIQDIAVLFPTGVLYMVYTELIGAAAELGVILVRDYLNNPDTETDIACDLFCYWRTIQPSAPYNWSDDIWKAWRDGVTITGDYYFSPPNVAANPLRGFIKTVILSQGTLRGAQQFYLGLNDCSNDWVALCLDCPPSPLCKTLDFTIDPYDFSVTGIVGSWVEGIGFEVSGTSASTDGIQVSLTFSSSIRVLQVNATYLMRWGSTSNVTRGYNLQLYESSVLVDENSGAINGNGGAVYARELEIFLDNEIDEIRMSAFAGADGSGAYARITSLSIRYEITAIEVPGVDCIE